MPNKKEQEFIESLKERGLNVRSASVSVRAQDDSENKVMAMDVVASTEDPALIYDWERGGVVKEVLLMSGFKSRRKNAVPFLNSHARYAIEDTLGKFHNFKTEGEQLKGEVVFDDDEEGRKAYGKYKSGSLTDVSIGYTVTKELFVKEGDTHKIGTKTYKGPMKIGLEWELRELSGVIIGADSNAFATQVKSFYQNSSTQEEFSMSKETQKPEPSPEEIRAAIEAETAAKLQKENDLKIEEARAEAVKAESTRQNEIRSLCQGAQREDLVSELCSDSNITVDQARAKILDAVIESRKSNGHGIGGQVEVGAEAHEKFRSCMSDAVTMRCYDAANVSLKEDSYQAESQSLRGMSLLEMGREYFRMKGDNVSYLSKSELITRMLSTDDLPNILGETLNKVLMRSYDQREESWKAWCSTGDLSDFKTNNIAQLGETDDLEEVLENGEYKRGTVADRKESVALKTMGKEYMFGRRMLINDDLGAMAQYIGEFGNSSARAIGDDVYNTVLLGNPLMGDSKNLFVAAHKNIGSSAAPSVSSVGEAVTLMTLQKDMKNKKILNLVPRYFIASVASQTANEQLFMSRADYSSDNPEKINPYANRYERVYEPRIDANDANKWFMAGDPSKTVKVFFLNGQRGPILERDRKFETDGILYRITLDYQVKALDWKALVYNAGA